jgi:hypothetical protein
MTRKLARRTASDRNADPWGDVVAAQQSDGAGAHADRLLVDRCLAGEVAAWEELYDQCHLPLCIAIKSLLGPGYRDLNLIDEIAARVWYALVRNDGELLDRFDPCQDLRLSTFLRGVARIEIMQYVRAERRRRAREAEAGRRPHHDGRLSDWQLDVMLNEFTATLTPGEQRFVEEYLLVASPEDDKYGIDLTDANIWQRRHRIRAKLRAFFSDD